MLHHTASSSASDLTTAVSWAALASALMAMAGVWAVRRQSIQAERSLLGSTSQFCYESMSKLLQQLVTNPELRPYLYENESLSDGADPALRQQVLAIAAQYVDFFDAVMLLESLGNVHDEEFSTVWRRFIRHMLTTSVAIRRYCLDHQNWYTPTLVMLAQQAEQENARPEPSD
jgi:hypothetical protein